MVNVSIVALIFKDIRYANLVYNGLIENTPMLRTGAAEFYFVVNFKKGVSETLIEQLKKGGYNYYIYNKAPDQLDYPANIGDIYRAWNFAAEKASGEIVVLINSDMYPAKNWLENLLKRLDKNKVVSPVLVESGKLASLLPHTVVKNFGRTPNTFQEDKFLQFVEFLKEDTEQPFGAFMPMAIFKDKFIEVNGYPNGNRVTPDGKQVSGDAIFFYERLASIGIRHITSFDSICYHMQEGESDLNG